MIEDVNELISSIDNKYFRAISYGIWIFCFAVFFPLVLLLLVVNYAVKIFLTVLNFIIPNSIGILAFIFGARLENNFYANLFALILMLVRHLISLFYFGRKWIAIFFQIISALVYFFYVLPLAYNYITCWWSQTSGQHYSFWDATYTSFFEVWGSVGGFLEHMAAFAGFCFFCFFIIDMVKSFSKD